MGHLDQVPGLAKGLRKALKVFANDGAGPGKQNLLAVESARDRLVAALTDPKAEAAMMEHAKPLPTPQSRLARRQQLHFPEKERVLLSIKAQVTSQELDRFVNNYLNRGLAPGFTGSTVEETCKRLAEIVQQSIDAIQAGRAKKDAAKLRRLRGRPGRAQKETRNRALLATEHASIGTSAIAVNVRWQPSSAEDSWEIGTTAVSQSILIAP